MKFITDSLIELDQDVLDNDLIDEIIITAENNPKKFNQGWHEFRKELDLIDFPVYEKIKKNINRKFSLLLNYDYASATIWKDSPGFYFDYPHVDNETIYIALQIYLNNNYCSGTTFYECRSEDWEREWNNSKKTLAEIKYKKNRGYMLFNYKLPRIPHITNKLENTENRLSLYVQYVMKT